MECISVFDMLKIGVGPSSSHTLGPWRAAERWIKYLKKNDFFNEVTNVKVDLYGSLSLTGKGHATDFAVILGLSGKDPETIPISEINSLVEIVKNTEQLNFGNNNSIKFDYKSDIIFNRDFLPYHSNGIKFTGFKPDWRCRC